MNALNNIIYNTKLLGLQSHGAVQEAAEHGGGHDEAIGDVLMHHVLDSHEMEFFSYKLHLPELPTLWGIDFSITKHIMMVWLAALLVFLVFKFGMKWKNEVPVGLTRFFEPIVLFVRDEIVYLNFGKDGKKFVPFFCTVFFFILFMNLIGMIPFMAAATSNVSLTAGLAGVSFLFMHLAGMAKYGPLHHFKNFIPSGLPAWIVPIIFPVELIGTVGRSVALCIRLFAAMTAGHIVIYAFLGLIIVLHTYFIAAFSVPVAVFISLLEVFFAFLQAYIFTFLTALFVSMTYHVSH
ncbi:MAG: F0F1 ATP synthase subunit A [bacterium]|nr:F0F1 ATP synthase subunit A [bacterium]